jgi:cyanophycinase-like exopeptidase
MKKLLIVGGAVAGVAGAAFLAKRFASSSGGPDFERWIERMPDNAPPKWIFRNVTAIRENTERILRLLDREDRSEAS